MATTTWRLVFKILFLVLIAHTFRAPLSRALNQEAWQSREVSGGGHVRPLEKQLLAEQPDAGELESAVLVDESQLTDGYQQSAQPAATAATASSTTDSPGHPVPSSQVTSSTPATAAPAVNYAELCYLSNGGSSLTLTVNEATQVNGDPALDGGNVDLFVVPDARAQGAQNGTSGSYEPAGGDPKRRLLSRRSASSATIADTLGSADEVATPTRRSAGGQQVPLSAGQMLGLVSDFQSAAAAAGHSSASYYSLLSSSGPSSAHASAATAGPPPGPALRLERGSRDLILVRPLDKESAEGEAGLVVSVRCRPRPPARGGSARSAAVAANSADSTTIPVRITVTDANDHAPEFVVGPRHAYVLNVSETAAIGSVVSRDVLAIDRDSAGPFSTLHYRVLEDGHAHSALLQFASPLDPTLLVAGALDYETLSSFTLTIVAQDQGEPEPLSGSAQVQVNVIDFDDQNPKFLDDKYTLIMDESQQNLVGQNLQVLPRNLYAEDGDRAINAPIVYSFDQLGAATAAETATASESATGASSGSIMNSAGNSLIDNDHNLNLVDHYLHLNPNSGELRLLRQWPNKWMNSPMTLVVRATQADNKDRYALTTLTITRTGSGVLNGNRAATTQASSSSAGTKVTTSGQVGDESLVAAGTESSGQAARDRQGIQFANERLSVQVLESVPINEKIARVRARYLNGGSSGDSSATSGSGGSSSSSATESQVVDLVQDWQLKVQNKTRRNRPSSAPPPAATVSEQQVANKRPINYQILDDQTDQFGINGLGEIFVKRPLDYELKQEYKFRVLATYTKYSDICQVQVNVLNVNDNRPKFTQPQYSFHLTESRLRSNVIGAVQAHDSDLNDTIRYSLSGEQAHLFEINQLTGQLRLKSSIKQLNMAACQLTVQATDSLAAPFHQHQARVNLHIAPQLVGRSINLEHLAAATGSEQEQQQQLGGSKSFNSRSLNAADRSRSVAPANLGKDSSAAAGSSNQRSSVATVMSSLQHMVRSVNFLEMPMSSALLLSALLAFLVCLLFIVIISMSVHLYRRRSKSRHRHHLAAAAHLRHAHMAAQLHSPPAESRYLQGGGGGGSSSNSSPTNSTAAGGSPGNFSPAQPAAGLSGSIQAAAGQAAAGGRLLVKAVPLQRSRPTSVQTAAQLNSPPQPPQLQTVSSALPAALQRGVSAAIPELSLISSLSSHSKRSYRSNTTDDSSVMHCGHYSVNPSRSPCQQQQQQQQQPPDAAACSAVGEPPAAKLTADCLQRSAAVEAAIKSLVRQDSGQHLSEPAATTEGDDEDQMGDDEATLRRDATTCAGNGGHASSQAKQVKLHRSAAFSETRLSQQPNEMAELAYSKPGIKAYRKLPLMGSLARSNRVGVAPEEPATVGSSSSSSGSERRATGENAQDSAIASDASSSGGSGNQQHQQQQQQQQSKASEVSTGLMAMIRDVERRSEVGRQQQRADDIERKHDSSGGDSSGGGTNQRLLEAATAAANIRWPQDALPQRVKKLTWDDELSVSNEDCFVAPDLRATLNVNKLSGSSMSPLSNHLYLVEGTTTDNEDHYAEQHFLFSNPCSPALLSVDYGSTRQPLAQDEPPSSFMGQNNCFDYTIVQSSQFQVDQSQFNVAAAAERFEQNSHQQSLSAQHHLLQLQLQLQQQQQQQQQSQQLQQQQNHMATKRPNNSYLYSNSFINNQPLGGSATPAAAATPNQDLKLMTTAVL